MYKQGFLIVAALLLFACGEGVRAQSPDKDEHRFEAGAQLSLLDVSSVRGTSSGVPCLSPPCIEVNSFERTREAEVGFGGRIGYNVNRYFALEAEVNFFPQERRFEGRQIELLSGVKVGRRFEKAGVFGKARPGFLSTRTSLFTPRAGTLCIAIFPAPAACFDETSGRQTNFALDIGGVLELYPTARTIVRFDAGDTITRLDARRIIAPSVVTPGGVVVGVPSKTTHNFQGSVSMGFRF